MTAATPAAPTSNPIPASVATITIGSAAEGLSGPPAAEYHGNTGYAKQRGPAPEHTPLPPTLTLLLIVIALATAFAAQSLPVRHCPPVKPLHATRQRSTHRGRTRRQRLHYHLYLRCLRRPTNRPPRWFNASLSYLQQITRSPSVCSPAKISTVPCGFPHPQSRQPSCATYGRQRQDAQTQPSVPPTLPILRCYFLLPLLILLRKISRPQSRRHTTLSPAVAGVHSVAHNDPPPTFNHLEPAATLPDQIQLLVHSISGRTITIDTTSSASSLQVKQAIQEKDGTPVALQRLRFNGKYLDNNTTISTAGISNLDCVHVSLSLRGGSTSRHSPTPSTTKACPKPPRPESQRRAAKWRERVNSETPIRNALYEYELGLATVDRPLFPTVSELKESASKHLNSKEVKKKGLITDHFGLAKGIAAARLEQKHVTEALEKQVKDGGVGYVPTEKEDNIGRFVFENYNSLSPWGDRRKVHELNKLLKFYSADCALGVELQVQWDLARKEDSNLRLDRLLLPGQDKRAVTSHNRHEDFSRSQHGGTSIATFDRLSQFVQSTGSDPHGLGRWSWMQVGAGQVSTRIVCAYLPCSSKPSSGSKTLRYQTVYNQHSRYFRSVGDHRCPRTIFVDHLGQQIALWKAAGEQVIVFTDANSDVYSGILAQRLNKPDIRMRELCREILGKESPNSHSRGTTPLTGVFATSEIRGVNAFQSGHGGGIGDHRVFIVDVDMGTLIGEDFPKVVRLPGRKLQASRLKIRKAYIRSLRKNIKQHRLIEKYESLLLGHHSLSDEDKQKQIDKLDLIKTELMTGAEANCRKIYSGKTPYSPTISKWLARRRVFVWMLRHKERPLQDPRNLFRKCRVLDKAKSLPIRVKQPSEYTINQVKAQIVAIDEQIKLLREIAPELRLQHMRKRKKAALDSGQKRKAKEIEEIIRREDVTTRFRNIKLTTSKKKGGGRVYKVDEHTDGGIVLTHCTKEDIERVAGQTIGERYRLAYSAPIMANAQLLSDVGIAGDGPAMLQILEGNYTFPPDTDEYTKLLITEAVALYHDLGGEDGIEDFVSRTDFQQFWRTAKEKTESSKSGKHFGHYKAAAFDNTLSQLHATSLNAIRETGKSPARWRCSVTVLLEKVMGVRRVDKLRAICLLEADFNWLNKLIFAHRLERHCRQNNIVPPEQFAKSKSSCEEASLVKNLICDIARILHNSLAIVSADLDQCFDRSNGAIAAVGARAHGVSENSTSLMLNTMQLMDYFVKTGFGIADTPSFGGTEDNRLMSLGQGSGAAPMGMRNIITLTDNAYKRLGHGMTTHSAISQRLFLLAAIIYVDDTDLIHWAKFYGMTDDDFIADVQKGVTDWGKLVQASGGSLKQSKSFWYLLSWKFVRGVPTLKTQADLPDTVLYIPQPDGSSLPIDRCDNSETKKTLGVHNNPLNDCKLPLKELKNIGLEWIDSLRARPLEKRDTWLSLTSQQYPKWGYGLTSLYAPPDKLDETINSVYFQALPFLGFNRNINAEYRTLPTQYQGINLRQWSIEKLHKDIAMLLRHWGSNSTLSHALQSAYEAFQMELGLDGNIFSRPYSKYKDLVSHSWFALLWQYATLYNVVIHMNPRHTLKPTRIGDIALIELFSQRGYSGNLLVTLNRVRKYYRVHSLADILLADGKTLNPQFLLRRQANSSRTFSWEQPTTSDFEKWNSVLRNIMTASLTYSRPLGAYTEQPHIPYEWFASPDKQAVYNIFPGGYNTFKLSPNHISTRSGPKYTKTNTSPGSPPPGSYYASVSHYEYNHVCLQSSCPPLHLPSHHTSFLQKLSTISSDSLWQNLQIEDDGDWILQSIVDGTLIVSSDGSYMPDKSTSACSGAFILHCTNTKKEIRGCFTDSSPEGDNYRGEILGTIGPLIIIDAAIKSNPSLASTIPQDRRITFYCDNRGVVLHGNNPTSALKDEQVQSDLLRLLKSYSRNLPCQPHWIHVHGHSDDNTPYDLLTLPQKLNTRCDKLAKQHLRTAILTSSYTPAAFPNEDIVISVNSFKVRSSVREAVYKYWGKKKAKALFEKRDKVVPWAFDDIYWDDMDKIMNKFPKTFQDWTTRHISDFNGCNRYLSRHKQGVQNSCPSCGQANEDTEHITRCPDPNRTKLYKDDVNILSLWMTRHNTPADIAMAYRRYLLGRGAITMAEICVPFPRLHDLAAKQDAIGFDNLIIGRLPKALLPLVKPSLQQANRRGLTPQYWAKNLAYELILFTHKQWTYRNGTVHYKPSEGKTVKEHQTIDEHVKSLLTLPHDSLLPHHRHLLSPACARQLCRGTSTAKQFWIAEVQAALNETHIIHSLQKKNCTAKKEKVYVTRNNVKAPVDNITSPLFPATKKQPSRKNDEKRKN